MVRFYVDRVAKMVGQVRKQLENVASIEAASLDRSFSLLNLCVYSKQTLISINSQGSAFSLSITASQPRCRDLGVEEEKKCERHRNRFSDCFLDPLSLRRRKLTGTICCDMNPPLNSPPEAKVNALMNAQHVVQTAKSKSISKLF